MELNCQSIFTNMIPFWCEAEIEANIVKTVKISRTKYNKIIETDGKLPECLVVYRENRKMSQLFEDALRESALQEMNANISPDSIISEVIDLLVKAQKVVSHGTKKIRDKILPVEYWIKTSVKDVEDFLSKKQVSGEIDITDIPGFMKTYLKGKKGGHISNSYKTESGNGGASWVREEFQRRGQQREQQGRAYGKNSPA
jgi:hypothetical protein